MVFETVADAGVGCISDDGYLCDVCWYPLGITNHFINTIHRFDCALTCTEDHVSRPGLSTCCVSAAWDL